MSLEREPHLAPWYVFIRSFLTPCAMWLIFRVVAVLCRSLPAEEEVYECDCLLNATGRVPNVFGVGLEEAGVDYNNRQGVVIDDYFR